MLFMTLWHTLKSFSSTQFIENYNVSGILRKAFYFFETKIFKKHKVFIWNYTCAIVQIGIFGKYLSFIEVNSLLYPGIEHFIIFRKHLMIIFLLKHFFYRKYIELKRIPYVSKKTTTN